MFINFIFLMFLFSGTQTADHITIKVRTFDQAGRPSSFIYDGGSIIISCRYKGSNPSGKLILKLLVPDETLKEGTPTSVVYKSKINSTLLNQKYICRTRLKVSSLISINYILCNPSPLSPVKVCSKQREYCQLEKNGSAQCKQINEEDCFFGKEKTTVDKDNKKNNELNLFPQFKYVCLVGDNRVPPPEREGGLCYALSQSSNVKPAFLADDGGTCVRNYTILLTDNYTTILKRLMMAGWQFVNVADTFRISAKYSLRDGVPIQCSAFANNKNISFEKVNTDAHEKYELRNLTRSIVTLQKPTNVFIYCFRKYIMYSTTLLAFSSDRDISYKLEKTKSTRAKRDAVTEVRVNVSTKKGLFVCAQIGKAKCKPKSDNPTAVATVELDTTTFEDYPAFFYIGLFASSPKEKYVLLYYKVVNTTVKGTGTGTIAPVIPGLNGSGQPTEETGTTKESCGVKGSTAIIAVLAVFAVIAVVVIIVLAVLLVKRKKDESRANEDEISATSE